jgi:hypothetical protein
MKKLIVAAAGIAMFAAAPATASVQVNFGGTTAIPGNNDFRTALNGLGVTQYASSGASLFLTSDAIITFELLGSESGFSDRLVTLSAPSLSYTEYTSLLNSFASPIPIGSAFFTAGNLANRLNFSAVGGLPATVGQAGFGIFLGGGAVSGQNVSTFLFAYDDQANNPDRDFDDMIIRATVNPVPEPATWAMMLVGFAGVGIVMRRQKRRERALRLV